VTTGQPGKESSWLSRSDLEGLILAFRPFYTYGLSGNYTFLGSWNLNQNFLFKNRAVFLKSSVLASGSQPSRIPPSESPGMLKVENSWVPL
jgi:hypothetical protein